MSLASLCPCGSLLVYAACCRRYHSGTQLPLTAEALMRSRYTAFVFQDAAYLLHTWDEATRPAALDLTMDPTIWHRLAVVKIQKGGAHDNVGQVEFKAFYAVSVAQYVLHELSHFIKRDDRWYYVDGLIKANSLAKDAATHRKNAPCACGSGKKYIRCCGAV